MSWAEVSLTLTFAQRNRPQAAGAERDFQGSRAPGAAFWWQNLIRGLDEKVWVEVLTSQEVVAVGLRTILETADSPFPHIR